MGEITICTQITSCAKEKSSTTKQKILKAVDKLMAQYNYDSITVRKICDIAGVSIGSFYHHFQTKEKLLTIYLEEDYLAFSKRYFGKEKNIDDYNIVEKILEIFKCCANHCYERGHEFVAGFQSTKNKGILPSPQENYKNNAVFTPMFESCIEILKQGKAEGLIDERVEVTKISYDLCLMCHGFLYNWCVFEGGLDFEEMIDRIFRVYLNSIVKKPNSSSLDSRTI